MTKTKLIEAPVSSTILDADYLVHFHGPERTEEAVHRIEGATAVHTWPGLCAKARSRAATSK